MPKNQPYKPWHIILQPKPDTNAGGLWLGDYTAALDKKSIYSKNIKTVITAATGLKVSYNSTVKHKILSLYDCQTQNISRYFQDTYKCIQEGLQEGNVYVHCFAGVSRSSTIVIAYLMRKYEWSVSQAFSFTKKKRKYIDPNPGFMRQLRKFERQLFQKPKAENGQSSESTQVDEPKKLQTSFLEGFRRYRSPQVKHGHNKQNIDAEQTSGKENLRLHGTLKKPVLVQDLAKIYMRGQTKGKSLNKTRKLPELVINRTNL